MYLLHYGGTRTWTQTVWCTSCLTRNAMCQYHLILPQLIMRKALEVETTCKVAGYNGLKFVSPRMHMLESYFTIWCGGCGEEVMGFPDGSAIKNLSALQETQETPVQSLSQEVPWGGNDNFPWGPEARTLIRAFTRIPGELATPFALSRPCENTRSWQFAAQKTLSESMLGTLDLRSTFRTMRNNFILYKLPSLWYFILAA